MVRYPGLSSQERGGGGVRKLRAVSGRGGSRRSYSRLHGPLWVLADGGRWVWVELVTFPAGCMHADFMVFSCVLLNHRRSMSVL